VLKLRLDLGYKGGAASFTIQAVCGKPDIISRNNPRGKIAGTPNDTKFWPSSSAPGKRRLHEHEHEQDDEHDSPELWNLN